VSPRFAAWIGTIALSLFFSTGCRWRQPTVDPHPPRLEPRQRRLDPVVLPDDAPRCGDGVAGQHTLACFDEYIDSSHGTSGPNRCCTHAVEACDGEDLRGMTCESMGFGGGALGCRNCVLDTSECRACVESDRVTCGAVDEPGKVLGMVSWGKTAALLGLQSAGTARFIRISSSLEMVVEHRIERVRSTMMTTEGRVFVTHSVDGQAVLSELVPSSTELREIGKFYDHTRIQEAALTEDGRTLLGFSPTFNVLNWISVDNRGAARPAEPAEGESATYDSKAARRPVTLDPPAFEAPTQGPTPEFLEGYSAAVEGGQIWISARTFQDKSALFTFTADGLDEARACSEIEVDFLPQHYLAPTARVAEVAFVREGG